MRAERPRVCVWLNEETGVRARWALEMEVMSGRNDQGRVRNGTREGRHLGRGYTTWTHKTHNGAARPSCWAPDVMALGGDWVMRAKPPCPGSGLLQGDTGRDDLSPSGEDEAGRRPSLRAFLQSETLTSAQGTVVEDGSFWAGIRVL